MSKGAVVLWVSLDLFAVLRAQQGRLKDCLNLSNKPIYPCIFSELQDVHDTIYI